MAVDAVTRTRIVGELACQRDSYLQILDTIVVSCKEAQPKSVNSKTSIKESKNASNVNPAETTSVWEIEFADSVLFPEGIPHISILFKAP